MADPLTALALAVALEGVAYALFPATMRRFILLVLDMSDAGLRLAGLSAALAGVAAMTTVRFLPF